MLLSQRDFLPQPSPGGVCPNTNYFIMSLQDHIDISPPEMERDAEPMDEEKARTEDEPSVEQRDGEGEEPKELTEEEKEVEKMRKRAEELLIEISRLRSELEEREEELAVIKVTLGITPYTEFKESISQGWRVLGDKWSEVKDSDRYKKVDTTVAGWKQKLDDSETLQKTKVTLSGWGGKASDAVKKTGTAIKENETMQNIGQKMRSATMKLKEGWNKTMSTDEDAETVEEEKKTDDSQPIATPPEGEGQKEEDTEGPKDE